VNVPAYEDEWRCGEPGPESVSLAGRLDSSMGVWSKDPYPLSEAPPGLAASRRGLRLLTPVTASLSPTKGWR